MFKQFWNSLSTAKKIFLLFFFLPAIAFAVTVTHQQIVNAIKNSPTANSWLKQNANSIANLAINVESGGALDIYNGSCCYGVLQMNKNNIRVYAKMTPEQFRKADLQTQINAWAQLTSDAMKNPVVQKLASMKTFDGRPVTGELVLACIQLGVGNCNKMLQSGSCNGFKDKLGTSICDMADKMAKGKGSANTPNVDDLPPEPPTIFSADLLDHIMNTFEDNASKWSEPLLASARYLFWTLVTLSLTWTGIRLIMQRSDISDFFYETVNFILVIGFFYWLLDSGTVVIKDIVESFIGLGLKASKGTLTTSTYIASLFDMWARAFLGIASLDSAEMLAAIIMMVITFIALALIAVNFVLMNITAWVYLYAGIFVLGFGGSHWTKDSAVNYCKQILNIGLQLMTIIIIMNVCETTIISIVMTSNELQIMNYVILLLIGVILALLSNKLPAMVGSTVTGLNGISGFSVSSAANTTLAAGVMLLSGTSLLKASLFKALSVTKSKATDVHTN